MPIRSQRVRDPVHGLIVFSLERLDQLAWSLLDTPEMQRLRRIKQLGMSEFVFPGATHSRFAHSVGVFHTARALVGIIARELPTAIDKPRSEVAVVAALLHDVGHGPLSHTFEDVQKGRGQKKRHEEWSADIITNPNGHLFPKLEEYRVGLADEVAELLVSEVPSDIYHAIVSSSFDADRLDYLRRDRMMTGSGAGAIDFDWLLDNLTVADIDIEVDDESSDDVKRASFCLKHKAIQAAENFLLARYHLYTQVYLHKTTRGMEQMMGALLRVVATAISQGKTDVISLPESHPLVTFFSASPPTIPDYLALDDIVIWSAVSELRRSGDAYVSDLADRLLNRRVFKGLDLESTAGKDPEPQRRLRRRIDKKFATELSRTVLKDEPKVSIYGEVGADDTKAHKRLMILMPGEGPREITSVSSVIEALEKPKEFVRYYFETDSAREAAKAAKGDLV